MIKINLNRYNNLNIITKFNKLFIKNKKLIISNLFVFITIFNSSCSIYKETFSGKDKDYYNASDTPPLITSNLTNASFSIKKDSYYNIPNIKNTWVGPIKDLAPPGYYE